MPGAHRAGAYAFAIGVAATGACPKEMHRRFVASSCRACKTAPAFSIALLRFNSFCSANVLAAASSLLPAGAACARICVNLASANKANSLHLPLQGSSALGPSRFPKNALNLNRRALPFCSSACESLQLLILTKLESIPMSPSTVTVVFVGR